LPVHDEARVQGELCRRRQHDSVVASFGRTAGKGIGVAGRSSARCARARGSHFLCCIRSAAQGWAWAQSQALEYHASASSRADRLFTFVQGLYIDRRHMESLVGVLWAFAAADDGAGDGDCAKVLARLRELEVVSDSDLVPRRSKKARTRSPSPSPACQPPRPLTCSTLRVGRASIDGDATASAVAALMEMSASVAAPEETFVVAHAAQLECALAASDLAAAYRTAVEQKQAEIRALREAFLRQCHAAAARVAASMTSEDALCRRTE
jgi:hypothetical protein